MFGINPHILDPISVPCSPSQLQEHQRLGLMQRPATAWGSAVHTWPPSQWCLHIAPERIPRSHWEAATATATHICAKPIRLKVGVPGLWPLYWAIFINNLTIWPSFQGIQCAMMVPCSDVMHTVLNMNWKWSHYHYLILWIFLQNLTGIFRESQEWCMNRQTCT